MEADKTRKIDDKIIKKKGYAFKEFLNFILFLSFIIKK
jgi:hypothetical protein